MDDIYFVVFIHLGKNPNNRFHPQPGIIGNFLAGVGNQYFLIRAS
jgi:hypothetical protein